MSEIFHILKFKILSSLNETKLILKKGLWRSIASSLIFIFFGIGIFIFTRNTLNFLLVDLHIGNYLLHRFLSMILFVFFISINVGNLIVAYSIIYRSQEIYHLMTKPIDYSNLFLFKMFESILYSSPAFLLIGISVIAGYGSFYQVDWLFYPYAILVVFIPFVFTSAIVGILILMLLIMIANKIGFRQTITLMMTFYLLNLFLFFRFLNPKNIVNEVMKFYPNLNFDFTFLDPSFLIYFPNHWFVEAIRFYVRADYSLAGSYAFLILSVFALTLITAALSGKNFYYKTWLTSLELMAKSKNKRRESKLFTSRFKFFKDPQLDILFKKEIVQFFREPSQWIHLVVISFLIIIFIASVSRVNLIKALPFLQTVTYLILFIFNSFIISSITLRFLFPNMSIEAEAFFKIKSSPVALWKIIAVKFFPVFIITLMLSEALNFFSHLPISNNKILLTSSTINMFFVMLTLSSINFGMGSYYANFKEENPVKVASSQGATISFLINLVYLVFLIVILVIPVNHFFNSINLNQTVNFKPFAASTISLMIVAIFTIILSFKISVDTLKKDF